MKRRVLGAWMAWVLVGSGCGYRLAAGGVPFPGGVRKARAGVFANRTGEPGIEVWFTRSLREQLARSGALVTEGESEDGLITGEILSTSFRESIPRAGGGLTSYRLEAAALMKLSRGSELLSEATVTATEEFLAGVDPLQTEAYRGAAMRRLSDTLVRAGLERLATGF